MVLLVSASQAATITVCSDGCDYANIWEAMDAATPGDKIEVQSGTYYENIIIDKQLMLLGNDTGNGLPMIDGSGKRDVATLNADGIALKNFIITNSGDSFGNDAGLKVLSNNNIITNNQIISNNANGIFATNCNNNSITKNILTDNKYHGIELSKSNNNEILWNTANNSGYACGIFIYYSNDNIVSGNIISDNSRHGIDAEFSEGNLIYQNFLLNNKDQNTYENGWGNNLWDNGSIGNYYSDFDEPSEGCKDKNIDGVCDFRYEISGTSSDPSVDRYPLLISKDAIERAQQHARTSRPADYSTNLNSRVQSVTDSINKFRSDSISSEYDPTAAAKVQNGRYPANSKTHVYHEPGCTWADKIEPENLIGFNSPQDAEAAGYRHCEKCQ